MTPSRGAEQGAAAVTASVAITAISLRLSGSGRRGGVYLPSDRCIGYSENRSVCSSSSPDPNQQTATGRLCHVQRDNVALCLLLHARTQPSSAPAARSSPTTCANLASTCSRRYYLKESRGSRRWLIFLEGQCYKKNKKTKTKIRETVAKQKMFAAIFQGPKTVLHLSHVRRPHAGGWYCFNKENCDSRYETMRRLMSSSKWPQTKTGQSLLVSSAGFPARTQVAGRGRVGWGGGGAGEVNALGCRLRCLRHFKRKDQMAGAHLCGVIAALVTPS